MAEIPPWIDVRPQNFVQAAEAGAQAGIATARTRQAGEENSAALALQAQRMREQAQADAARLSQQERMAQMEMEARKEIAEQNFQRKNQEDLIQNAYRQAELGLRKSGIELRDALAQQKAKEAALTFAQESGFARHVAEGGDIATGLMKFPRARGVASVLKPKEQTELGPIESSEIPGGKVIGRKGSAHWQYIPEPQDKIIRDAKDGSIVAVKPSGEIKVLQPPKVGKRDDLMDQPVAPEKPSLFERAKALIGGGAPAPAKSPFKEGERIRNKKTGQLFVVRNGVPVPVETQSPPSHDETPPPEEGEEEE